MAPTRSRSTSASASASTTCRARRSECLSRGWLPLRRCSPAPNATNSHPAGCVTAPDAARRAPRWDPDERGIGVGDARAHLEVLDALRRVTVEPGWVAEEPENHLEPHLRAASGPLAIDDAVAAPDGTFEVQVRWAGPPGADRGSVRA